MEYETSINVGSSEVKRLFLLSAQKWIIKCIEGAMTWNLCHMKAKYCPFSRVPRNIHCYIVEYSRHEGKKNKKKKHQFWHTTLIMVICGQLCWNYLFFPFIFPIFSDCFLWVVKLHTSPTRADAPMVWNVHSAQLSLCVQFSKKGLLV